MPYSKPSDLLRAIDSHSIVNVSMLDECQFETEAIPCQSFDDTRREIEGRGLGGWLEGEGDEFFFTGWRAARGLANYFLGHAPGDAMEGRGSSFRMNLAALEQAGQ